MNKQIYLAAAGAFVIALALSVIIFGTEKEPEDVRAAYLPGGEFTLSHGDQSFDMRSLRGQPYVLYFGFTHCPDVCPLGLATIRDALNQYEELSQARALFVTVDPARDTPQHIEEYASFFHPNILGRSGTLAETQALAKAYGTYFMAAEKDAEGHYNVDHTAYYYLINAEGKLSRVLDHNVTSLTIADELRKLL